MTIHNQFNHLQADEMGKLAQITPEELCDDCGEVNHSWSYNKPTGEAGQLCSGCYDNQSEAPSYDEVSETYAADAWHDANEYPDW